MKKRYQNIFGGFLMVMVLFLMLHWFYGDVMKGGKSRFFVDGEDGFKNYVTVMYHVKHDKDYWHYEGMNYPYGDHVIFTDNQPILANSLKYLNQFFPEIASNIPATMHWVNLVTLILSGLFLFLTFKRFKLPNWYSIMVVVGVVLLSPQVNRISGHFGLGHAVVIPLIIYLLLLWESTKRWSYLVLMYVVTVVFSLLHLYYLGILMLVAFYYGLFKVLFNIKDRQAWYESLMLAGYVVVAFVTMTIWSKMGVPVLDRPSHPGGYLIFRSQWESILLNENAPILSFLDQYVVSFRRVQGEGKAYIGLVSLVLFFWLLGRMFVRKFRLPMFAEITEHRSYVRILFAAGVAIVLFGIGIPFIIPGLEPLIYYLGPIGQLRSIGRFSWVFFYVFNILAFITLYKYVIKQETGRKLSWILLFPILLLWSDSFVFMTSKVRTLYDVHEFTDDFLKSDEYWFNHINAVDYQAILPIPFYHVGGEYLGAHLHGNSFFLSQVASVHSGLPVLANMMSRTSLSQTIKACELGKSFTYRIPSILEDLPSNKPLLVIASKEGLALFNPEYDAFVKNGKKVFENKSTICYEFPLSAFAIAPLQEKNAIQQELTERKLFPSGNMLASDSLAKFFYESFDDQVSAQAYLGQGALSEQVGRKGVTIFQGRLPNHQKGNKYAISFWVYVGEGPRGLGSFKIIESDEHQDKQLSDTHSRISLDYKLVDKDWAFMTYEVELKSGTSELEITIFPPEYGRLEMYVDELLIRPAGLDIYGTNGVWKNNLHY